MRPRLSRFLPAALVVVAAFEARAADRPQITWIIPAFAPVTTGEARNAEGYADKALDYLIARTPEFDHVIERANLARFFLLADSRDAICHPALVRTGDPGETQIFSLPAYRTLGNRLITTEKTAVHLRPHLNDQGALPFAALKKQTRLTLGYSRSRAYGQEIGSFIAWMDSRRQAYDVNSTATTIRMLMAGRIDYTFVTPVQAGYYFSRGEHTPRARLASFTLEGAPSTVESFFACSQGPVSERVIASFNKLIPTEEFRASWWPTYERWLDEESLAEAGKILASR